MRLLLVLFSVFLFSQITFAQDTGSVSGLVMIKDAPIAGASVTLTGPGRKTATVQVGASGKFAFDGLKPGTYYINAVKEMYRTGREIKIERGQELTIDLDLVLDARRIYPGTLREYVTIAADAAQPAEETSKTVNLIRGQEMRDRADITLVDSLRTIPGFRVQQLGGFGRTASIKSRGLRNQDTAVLIDGVRFRDPASITGDATAFLSDITLTSVSRVEVLRGPGSSLYGTNAVGGTIDFQTPGPESGWHGQVSGAGGGLGLGRFRGNVSHGGSKFGFTSGISRTVFTKGIDDNDDARNTNFQSRVDFIPFNSTVLSGRFFFSDAFAALNTDPDTFGVPPASNRGVIDAVSGFNFAFDADDPDAAQRSRIFNGQFVATQSLGSKISLRGYYSGLTTRRRNDNGVLGAGFQSASTSIFEGTIHTANAHVDWQPSALNRFTAGYEFEQEDFRNEGFTPSGTEDFFTDASQSSSTIYLQNLVRLLDGRLQFGGGFRAQFHSLGTPGFSVNNAPYSNLVLADVPSAYTFDGSASYFIARTGTKFRTHVGNGYRVPSLYERFGSFYNTFTFPDPPRFEALGFPFLKPEKTAAFDAGIEQYLFGRKASISVVFFYTRLTDIIGFGNEVPDVGDTSRPFGGYENQKGGVARGIELSGEVKPTSSTTVYASYTLTNSDQLRPQVTGSGVYKTLGVPNHQFTFNATQRIRKIWVNADFLGTSSYLAPIFSNFNFNSYVYRFDGNRRLDLTAGFGSTIDGGKYNLRLFATVENLFDNEYFENGFRTPGRNGRVGLSFGF